MRYSFYVLFFLLLAVPCLGGVYTVDSSGEGDLESIADAVAIAQDCDIIEVACNDWDPNYIRTLDLGGKDVIIKSDCSGERSYFDRNGFHTKDKLTKPAKPVYVPGELIVKYKRTVSKTSHPKSIENLNRRHKLRSHKQLFKNFRQHSV